MTGSGWDADDLAQETFVQALRSIGNFRGESSIETWLYAILINQERKWRRSKGRFSRIKELWSDLWQSRPVGDATDRLETEEWMDTIWSQVAELPESQRHSLVLRYSEDLPLSEIATVCECPEGTVKSRLHHGLQTLKEKCRAMQANEDFLENSFVHGAIESTPA